MSSMENFSIDSDFGVQGVDTTAIDAFFSKSEETKLGWKCVKDDYERLLVEHAELTSEKKELTALCKTQETQIEQLTSEKAALETTLSETIKTYDERVAGLETSHEVLIEKTTKQKDVIAQMESLLSESKAELTTKDEINAERLGALTAETSEQKSRIAELEKQKREFADLIKKLTARVTSLSKEKEDVEKESGEHISELQVANKKLEEEKEMRLRAVERANMELGGTSSLFCGAV